jgi:hypothetical protein
MPGRTGPGYTDVAAAACRRHDDLRPVDGARARAEVDTVERLITEEARTGTLEDNAQLRLRGAKIGLLCRDAVAHMVDGAGSSLHHSDDPLGRAQRDINVAKAHAYCHWDEAATQAGYALLGLMESPHMLLLA